MRIVIGKLKIFKLKIKNALHIRVDVHLRQMTRLACELQIHLLQMVGIDMRIAKGMHKSAGLQTCHLRYHHREQRITGNIERHTQKDICTALVKLARQFTFVHIKLHKAMAWRKCHRINFTCIPSRNYQTTAGWVVLYLFDELLQLVNTDSYVRDALYFGLEGDNFTYTEDGKVHKNNNDWTMAGYTQGTFFNVSLLDSETENQWDEVKALNEQAKPSPALGFNFNTAPVADELAAKNLLP